MSDRYARLIELPDRPVADWDRIPADGELFRDGTDVYMGDGVTDAPSLTPINGGGGGGNHAPKSAQYVTLAHTGALTHERVLTAGTGISITDGGANGHVTIAATGGSTRSYFPGGWG